MTIQQRRDDYPNPWRIQMRGHPARRESISWREAIRDAVTDTYPQAPFTSPPLGTKFTVEVIFRMTPEDLARPAFDLDNFAKPVLDTLFTSQNVSRLAGVLLPGVNDTWVFRLLLEKVEVKTPQRESPAAAGLSLTRFRIRGCSRRRSGLDRAARSGPPWACRSGGGYQRGRAGQSRFRRSARWAPR